MTVGCQQKVLARLGVKFQPVYQRYVAPSDIAIRKAIAIVDGVVLDERGYPEKVDTRYAALAASCNASSKSMGLVFLFFSHLRVVLYQFTYHSIPARSSSMFEKTCR